MRSSVFAGLAGLTGFVFSQSIDLDFVEAHPVPTYKVVADQQKQTVEYDRATAIAKVVADVVETPVAESEKGSIQADDDLRKRDGTVAQLVVTQQACEPIVGTLYGDHNGDSEDVRVQKFLNNAALQEYALNATTPTNYTLVFKNLSNSSEANGYLGYSVLSSYNVPECAAKCSNTTGCQAFNIYFERDPSAVPGPSCPNPPALLNPKCALWGGPVSADNALNAGQHRELFHVVMTASNGYVLDSTITPFSTFAINAPLDCNGNNTYMGMRLITDGGPFSPDLCAAICDETSRYSNEHPSEDPMKPPQLCTFYNTYLLYKNSVSQGQVCAMYSQSWDPREYAKNDGQYDGQGNRFTISSSFFSGNVSSPVCSADIEDLQDGLLAQVFCTSYISYTPPATVRTTIASTSIFETCSTPTPTATIIGAAAGKRDASTGGVLEAVIAIYPNKVADPAITGNEPAKVTISAQDLSIAAAYTLASEEASSQLTVSETRSDVFRTGWNEVAVTHQATPTPSVNKRQGALTPDILSGRDYREVSSICSRIVDTSTPTTTLYAPDATLRPAVDCSNFTVCVDGSPPTLIAGSFTNASYRVDDIYYNISLPFEICIFGTCNSTVWPSSNGIITLGNFATANYNNEADGIPASFAGNNAVLYVYWDDLYIFPGQNHYLAYSICGQPDSRSVTFLWRVGHYNIQEPVFDGRTWEFSATFYEAGGPRSRSGIDLVYTDIPDDGASASLGAQGVLSGQHRVRVLTLAPTVGFPIGFNYDFQNPTESVPF